MMLTHNVRTNRSPHQPIAAAAIALATLLPLASFTTTIADTADTPSEAATPSTTTATTTAAPETSPASTTSGDLSAEQTAVLQKLRDSDYMVRDLAMTTLLADDQLTDAAIDKLYAHATTAEQRVRLRQVAVHHTARRLSLNNARPTDSAVLGMSPAPLNNIPPENVLKAHPLQSAVLVRWTFPGSVAFAHLRQGDVITHVNNKEIPAAGNAGQITSAFIQLIAGRTAGDEISFDILRDGRPLHIKLKLGSGNALQSIYQSARTSQSRQFNAACEKLVQDRLAELDKITPPAKPLTLALPTPDDKAAEPAQTAEPAADAVTH